MHASCFQSGLRLCLALGILLTSNLKADEQFDSNYYGNRKLFVESLFAEKQYHRSISEIYRIKFDYSRQLDLDLELILLQSYYHLKEHPKVVRHSGELLATADVRGDAYQQFRIGTTLAASLVETGKTTEAARIWKIYCYPYDGETFPDQESLPEPIDPEKAKRYAAILPGSGFLLSQEYGKATVSFLLNLAFIAGIYHYGSNQQYGIAGVFTFFELGWYFGGQNAAYEAAENYNRKQILGAQRAWMNNKLY